MRTFFVQTKDQLEKENASLTARVQELELLNKWIPNTTQAQPPKAIRAVLGVQSTWWIGTVETV